MIRTICLAAAITGLAALAPAQAGTADNGVIYNGLAINGLSLNGSKANGVRANGLAINGADAGMAGRLQLQGITLPGGAWLNAVPR